MGNMSYCRFENTVHDLRDCLDHMDDDDLSDRESEARGRLVVLARAIMRAAESNGILAPDDDHPHADLDGYAPGCTCGVVPGECPVHGRDDGAA